jgi:cytochrome c-type biogenesis protein CcmH
MPQWRRRNGSCGKLAAKLEQEPQNIEGWKLLARSYGAMERLADAAAAYSRAYELDPGDHGVAADYAEAVQAADGKAAASAATFDERNQADPSDQNRVSIGRLPACGSPMLGR